MPLTLLSQGDGLRLARRGLPGLPGTPGKNGTNGTNGLDGAPGIGYLGARERPGDVLDLFTSALAGSAKDAAVIGFGVPTVGQDGSVLRVTPVLQGSLVVASRTERGVEPGQVYAARISVRRNKNSSDPLGDAIQFGISCLNAAKQKVSERIFFEGSVVVAEGLISRQVTFSRDQEADLLLSDTTRYVRPFVRIFGGDGITDVVVIGSWETSGLPGLKGDPGDLTELAQTLRDEAVSAASTSVTASDQAVSVLERSLKYPTAGDQVYDAGNRRVSGLANPFANSDAVNLGKLTAELDKIYNILADLTGIVPALAKWDVDNLNVRSLYGGSRLAQTGTTNLNASTTGRTFLSTTLADRVRQTGPISRIVAKLLVASGNPQNTIKFKLYRPNANGVDFDFIAETPLFSPTSTSNAYVDFTFNLATPLQGRAGDVVAVWMIGNATDLIRIAASTPGAVRFIAGDNTSTFVTSASTGASAKMCLSFEGIPPFVVTAGDSIFEGHNGGAGNQWHSFYDGGPGGNPLAEVYYHVKNAIPALGYQNFAEGGTNWTQTLAKVADINAVLSRAVHVHCGVNDISQGRTLAAVLADMTAFKAGLTHGQKLIIDAVLPWSAGSDAQSATVRAFNAGYKQWCIENGASFIDCHDEMGQIRPSTGMLDNLRTEYNQDGVHLTVPAGVTAFAVIQARELKRVSWVS